jgi:GT2 family glycosyltransferase
MNPALIVTRNCLELTQKCVKSLREQDIPVTIFIIDNGSRDFTAQWASDQGILLHSATTNTGFSAPVNHGLSVIFNKGAEHCFVVNNDTEFGPHTYSDLLKTMSPFVTGASWENRDEVMDPANRWNGSLTDGPDFSAFLVRKSRWEEIGPFDESMAIYCSDVDMDIRARRMGITLQNSHIKFYHNRSSTMRLASHGDRAAIKAQADADHMAFKEKYGMFPGQPGYEKLFAAVHETM